MRPLDPWFVNVFVAPAALGLGALTGCSGSPVDLTSTSSPSDGAPVDQRRTFPPPPPGGVCLPLRRGLITIPPLVVGR